MQIARPAGRTIFLRLDSLVFCMQNTIVPSARGGSLYFGYAHTLK